MQQSAAPTSPGAGRLGTKYTRWDAKRSVSSDKKEERRKGEMPQNWYSMTASEIYPLACADGVSEEALAIVTAKLCHQAQFWDGRSRFPVPLHAAKQMDLDHPQYRRTVTPEEKLTEEPGADGTRAGPESERRARPQTTSGAGSHPGHTYPSV